MEREKVGPSKEQYIMMKKPEFREEGSSLDVKPHEAPMCGSQIGDYGVD